MTNIPSFKVGSKPTLSEQEVDSHRKSTSKFIDEPGTYDMLIKEVAFAAQTEAKDSAWIQTTITLDHFGKTLKYWLSVPVECRNGYLYGDSKSTLQLDKLRGFFRGLGLIFDFDNGMSQVGAIFGSPDKLIGKSLKVRLGYQGPHIKYVGKDEFKIVDKDHVTEKVGGTFATKDAALAHAREEGLKIDQNSGFIKVQEIFPSQVAQIELESSNEPEADLPF